MPVTRSQASKLKSTDFSNEVETRGKLISPLKSMSLVNESSGSNDLFRNLQTPTNTNSWHQKKAMAKNDTISARSEPLSSKRMACYHLPYDGIKMFYQPPSLPPRITTSKFLLDTFGNISSTAANESNILIETRASFEFLYPDNLPLCKDRYFTSRSPPPLINETEDSKFTKGKNTPDSYRHEVRVVSSVLLRPGNQNETYFERGTANSPQLIEQENVGPFGKADITKNEFDDGNMKNQVLGSKSKTPLIEDNMTPVETTKHPILFEPPIVPKNLDSEGMFGKTTPLPNKRQRRNGTTNHEQVDVEAFMRQISSPPLQDGDKKVGKTSLRIQLQPRNSSWSIDYCNDLEYANRRKRAPVDTVRSCYFFGSPKPLSNQITQTPVKDITKNNQRKPSMSCDLTPPNIIRRTSTEMGIPAINPNFLSSFDPIKFGSRQRSDRDDGLFQEPPENSQHDLSSSHCKSRNIPPDHFDGMVDVVDGDIFCLDLLSTF